MCCVFVQYVLRICVCVRAHVVYVCTPLPSLLCPLLRPSLHILCPSLTLLQQFRLKHIRFQKAKNKDFAILAQ